MWFGDGDCSFPAYCPEKVKKDSLIYSAKTAETRMDKGFQPLQPKQPSGFEFLHYARMVPRWSGKGINAKMTKYGFFYPETGERFLKSHEFPTMDDAINFFTEARPGWQKGVNSVTGETYFVNNATGHVVVARGICCDGGPK